MRRNMTTGGQFSAETTNNSSVKAESRFEADHLNNESSDNQVWRDSSRVRLSVNACRGLNFKTASPIPYSKRVQQACADGDSVSDSKPSSISDRRRGVFSAIDLGTNNCRLLIARPTREGFRVIDAFSRIVRLGEGIAESGRLSDTAMDRTVEALKVCASKIDRRNVTCMRHVGTEALRVADNSQEFLDRVRRETGINLEIISAAEEARLAVMGCQSLIDVDNRHALVFDIGGGSTELIWVKIIKGNPVEMCGWMSIPWGVVNLTETYAAASTQGCAYAYQAMVDEVGSHLEAFEKAYNLRERLKDRKVQFLGTSGTVTTLASLHLNLKRYDRDRVDGAWMRSADISKLSRMVATMSEAERAAQPCIGSDRCDLVVAGCAILESLLSMWPVEQLRVADRGIREGILRCLMEDQMPVLKPRIAMTV